MNPGVDDARTGVLPHANAVAYVASATSGDVASPLTISTSGITAAGMKKCIPTTRSGTLQPGGKRRDRQRRRVRREDAIVARHVLDPREELALRVEILDDRLDHQLGDAHVGQRDDRCDPRERRIRVGLREPALGDHSPERLGNALLRGIAGAEPRVVQLHAVAVERGDLRDARAHGARADHGDGGVRGHRSGHRATDQRPVKCGGRLATNAATPSR